MNHTTRIVMLGSMINIEPVNIKDGSEKTWQLVTSVEANPGEGKISQDSPIGKALVNKQVGDLIIVKTPKKDIQYRIVKIY
jgi:transcription elongation factor GreA